MLPYTIFWYIIVYYSTLKYNMVYYLIPYILCTSTPSWLFPDQFLLFGAYMTQINPMLLLNSLNPKPCYWHTCPRCQRRICINAKLHGQRLPLRWWQFPGGVQSQLMRRPPKLAVHLAWGLGFFWGFRVLARSFRNKKKHTHTHTHTQSD